MSSSDSDYYSDDDRKRMGKTDSKANLDKGVDNKRKNSNHHRR